MANRKEEEKNERIIRGLLKLPENRRCINCNSLGPQYVCTSFWTFVCTTCSGIHREFTHRVKSVSMAKFTLQEVTSLQGGGNQRAKEIYFKEWDPQRSVPDSSNVDRLRDFIKHVYVDRRFTGDRGSDRPPRANTSNREESYQGGSRSPYEDVYDHRYSDKSSSGGRSPGYDQESRQYNDSKRSPGSHEVINDWRREDRFGNGRKAEDRRVSDGESRVGGSPDRPKDLDTSSPPVVRPVREILGENVVPLRVGEPPKVNSPRLEAPPQAQRTASSSSLGSTSGNQTEVKWENSASLIDFNSNPEPPAVAPPQVQPAVQAAPQQPASSTIDNNWASFDAVPEVKASHQAPPQPLPNVDSLDILSQLSVPAPAQPSAGVVPGVTNFGQGGAAGIASGANPNLPPNGVISQGTQPEQPSFFPVSGVQSNYQSTIPASGAPHNQPWSASSTPNLHGTMSSAPSRAPISNLTNVVAGGAMQNPPAELKSNARKELPADLFASLYGPYHAPVPMWQAGSPYGYGYGIQYNPTMMPLQPQPMPNFPVASQSLNPFDVKEPSPAQAPMFPSMASLQGALPNVPPTSNILHAPAANTPSAWASSQPSSYPSSMPSQAPGYATTIPPGAYAGQQMPSTILLPRPQGIGVNFANQPTPGSFPAAYSQSNPSTSVGGNPFG